MSGSRELTIVTGAAGMIGARLAEAFAADGAVVGTDHLPSFAERPEHAGLRFASKLSPEELLPWLEKNGDSVGRILHMGACSNTMETDWSYLERVNLRYTQTLWSFCAERGLPFVYASSGATYGAGELGYDDAPELFAKLQPLNLYGKSKLMFDQWALEQAARGFAPPVWAGYRFFNVYGYGERHKGRMASVVLHGYDQIKATGRMKLFKSYRPDYAHGEQKRDFVSVEDVVAVIRHACAQPRMAGVMNLGTGQARTFLDLARATFAAMGLPERIDFEEMPEILRDKYQYFTEAKIARLRASGYTAPFLPLEEGVRRYVSRLAGKSAS